MGRILRWGLQQLCQSLVNVLYLKISGFPRMTVAVFAGFQTLLILNIGEFQNLHDFRGIPVKILKFGGNSWISSQAY